MSIQLNSVVIAGNLTRMPVGKMLPGDRVVCEFGVAINRRWTDEATGEKKEAVTFVDVEAWAGTAELVVKYFEKGQGIYVEGRLHQDAWTDKEGQKHSRLKVVASSVQFTTPKRDGDQVEIVDTETGEVKMATRAPRREVVKAAAAPAAGANEQPPF